MDNRYPFAAIVCQEKVKRALIYNLIDPRTGGVVLCGEKGTAKSTAVRGLTGLLEQVDGLGAVHMVFLSRTGLVGSRRVQRKVHLQSQGVESP